MDEAFVIEVAPGRIVSTAVHAGHELRAGLVGVVALDPSTRLREEDPFTDRMLGDVGIRAVVNRSRFEVDLNRSREQAVYRRPEEAFGLNVWKRALQPDELEESQRIHDHFYAELSTHLDRLSADGPFLVLDVHSYNHRRHGRDAAPEPIAGNPEVNVGTGALDGRVRACGGNIRGGARRSAGARSSAGRSCQRALPGWLSVSMGGRSLPPGVPVGDRVQEGVHGRVDGRV